MLENEMASVCFVHFNLIGYAVEIKMMAPATCFFTIFFFEYEIEYFSVFSHRHTHRLLN